MKNRNKDLHAALKRAESISQDATDELAGRDPLFKEGFSDLGHMNAAQEAQILNALGDHEFKNLPVKNLTGTTFEAQCFGSIRFEIETPKLGVIQISVFNDCGEWDYIEEIQCQKKTWVCPYAPNGDELLMTRALTNWKPREESPRWGFSKNTKPTWKEFFGL